MSISSVHRRFLGHPAVLALGLAGAALAPPGFSAAQAQERPAAAQQRSYDIPPGPLSAALNRFAEEAGIYLGAEARLTDRRTSPGLKGRYSVAAGLAALLAGTGLEAVERGGDGYGLRPLPQQDDGALQLAPVTVTGEKMERSLQETATAVSVFKSGSADPGETASVYELSSRVPNMLDNAASLPTIRGVNGSGPSTGVFSLASGSRPRISTNVDGMAEGWSGQRYLDAGLWDVEQVEILRGPQSTIQGRNSIGGAIVVTTKDPTFAWEGAARMGYENNDDKVSLAGMVSGPLVEDELAVRVVAEGLRGNGYIDYSGFNDDYSELNRHSARAKLLWTPGKLPDLVAKLTLARSEQKGEYLKSVAGPDFSDYMFTSGAATNTRRGDTTNTSASADIRYDLTGALTAHLLLGHSIYNAKFFQSTANGFMMDLDEKSNTVETRLTYDPRQGPVSGVFGLYYYDRDQDMYSGPNAFSGDDHVRTVAAYGDFAIALTGRFGLILGGRVEREHQKRDVIAYPATTTPGHIDTDKSATMFLPKAGVTFKATPDTNLALTVRKGYSPGGGAVNFTTREYYEYGKEEVVTYEFSTRSALLDNRLSLNTNLFYNEYEGYQAIMNNRLVNIPRGETYGLEVETTALVQAGLEVFGGLGLLRSKVTETDGALAALKGNEFNSAPHTTASLGLRQRFDSGLFFGGDMTYVSSFYSDVDNNRANVAGNYATLNAHVGFEADRYALRAYVKNLSDVEIIQAKSSNGASATMGVPRTFGATVDYRF
jgi:Outer membrane receptor proteins, mostly Fe transport